MLNFNGINTRISDKLNSLVYSVFLTSGILKSFTNIFDFSFDLTLLSALYLVFVMLVKLSNKSVFLQPAYYKSLCLLLLFYMWLFISLFYTKSTEFGYLKFFLSLLNLIAFLFPAIVKLNFKVFLSFFVFISLLLGFINIYVLNVMPYDIASEMKLNSVYLQVGLLIGFTLILKLFSPEEGERSFYSYIIILLLFMLLVVSRARGPLLFLVITIMFFFFSSNNIRAFLSVKRNYFLLAFFAFLLPITTFSSDFLQSALNKSFERFFLIFSDVKGESIDTRFELYDRAFDFFSSSPIIGNGIGSFGLLLTGNESNITPHNIILEILSELGVVGFVIFFTFSLVLFFENRRRFLFKMLALFAALNVLKSYGFHDLRLMFGVLAVVIADDELYARASR